MAISSGKYKLWGNSKLLSEHDTEEQAIAALEQVSAEDENLLTASIRKSGATIRHWTKGTPINHQPITTELVSAFNTKFLATDGLTSLEATKKEAIDLGLDLTGLLVSLHPNVRTHIANLEAEGATEQLELGF